MGEIPTEIKDLFNSFPSGVRVPNERDLCDMLLYYSVMVDLGFPEADGHLVSHIVKMYTKAHVQWSTLFQYFGTKPQMWVKEFTLDTQVHAGTDNMRRIAAGIFHELGWIKGLDMAEEDGIILEQLEDVPYLTDKMIHTFLINRQMINGDWVRFFAEDFSLYKLGGDFYDTDRNIEQT
jgi:hypothetical protein